MKERITLLKNVYASSPVFGHLAFPEGPGPGFPPPQPLWDVHWLGTQPRQSTSAPTRQPGNAILTQAPPIPDLSTSLSWDDSLLWSRQNLKGYFQMPHSVLHLLQRQDLSYHGQQERWWTVCWPKQGGEKPSCGTQKVFPFRKANNCSQNKQKRDANSYYWTLVTLFLDFLRAFWKN